MGRCALSKACTVFFLIFASVFSFSCKKKIPPRTVNIAIQPSAAFIPLYIARYSNMIENALAPKNVTVVWQDFESGPPMNESLEADLTDIGVIGDVPTVRALSGGADVKLVGIPARGANAYALLASAKNSNFNSFKDMKGKKIATVFGSTGHNFVKKLLEKNGLSFEDIDFINIAASDAERVLKDKSADAVAIWEPNVTRLINKGVAKIVAQGDETDLCGTNGFVVRGKYLADNSDIIFEILNQYAEAAKQLQNLDDRMASKLSLSLNISADQIKSIAQKYDFNIEITDKDIDSLQDTISFLISINNLDNVYYVEKQIDKSYFQKARN